MKRVGASLILVCALASSAYAETPATATTTPVSSLNNPNARQKAAQSSIFSALVAQGDRERRAGRAPEAAQAYAQAIKIEWSPLVGGRLGVLLVELGQPTKAADILLDAIADAAEASPLERHGFLKAYDKAISEVCRVDIDISEAHTMLLIDGEEKFPNAITGFTLFLRPGDHELRAKLAGFQDAVYQFNASKGGRVRVPLVLVPIPTINPPKLPDALLRRHRLARREAEEAVKSLEEPPTEEEGEKRVVYGGVAGGPKPEKARISVEGGPLIVFGVATWAPAVGAVAGVRFRLKEYFSLGLEGRGAWLTAGIEGQPINAMTAAALATGCLHWRWLYGCAVGHLGVINVRGEKSSYASQSDTFVKPGFGGRVGASLQLGRGFVLGGSFEALGLNRRTKVVAGQTELVNHPAVMLGAQIVGAWEF